jgi:leader peptidase (prepilin peptidase) / N-methyltransferase
LPHVIYIIWFFMVGACVGSFLNVVVYRVPRGQSLVHPPSRCPKCEHPLAWYDNVPVFGWLVLGGKCRYCRAGISPRYPIVEAVTGTLFAVFYAAVFMAHQGPFSAAYDDGGMLTQLRRLEDLATGWPIFGLYLFTVAALLAASLIDAELYLIPPSISWLIAGAGLLVHTLVDQPSMPGALLADGWEMAIAAGGGVGLIVSIVLLRVGILPLSFASGGPPLEVEQMKAGEEELPDFTPGEVRREIGKEILFLLPPVLLAGAALLLSGWFDRAAQIEWLSGLLGALFGGLIGGGLVWLSRIVFSLWLGREAMGLGDVDLMFGVGAVVGAGAATVVFFISPVFGMPLTLAMYLLKSRRQLPFGPYLSIATAVVMLFYFPIYQYLRPGMIGLGIVLRSML